MGTEALRDGQTAGGVVKTTRAGTFALLILEGSGRCQRSRRQRRRIARRRRGLDTVPVAVYVPLTARPDLVPLDHLVERRRLDMQELGGALLDAAGGLERRFDELLLEIGDDVLERDALRRNDELRHLEVGRLAHVIRDQLDADARAGGAHDGA